MHLAHKARYALAVGAEDVRHRSLAAADEIGNIPEGSLPLELDRERKAIVAEAHRYGAAARSSNEDGGTARLQDLWFVRGHRTIRRESLMCLSPFGR